MLKSISDCQTVVELNRARGDLINQLFKRSITLEEFDVGYEYLYIHSKELGLKYHPEYRTYGPKNAEPVRQLLHSIKYSRFVNQFNQAYDRISRDYKGGLMPEPQYQMCWTLLLAQASFQGYDWNQYQEKFFES